MPKRYFKKDNAKLFSRLTLSIGKKNSFKFHSRKIGFECFELVRQVECNEKHWYCHIL